MKFLPTDRKSIREELKIVNENKEEINLKNKNVFITGVAGFIGANCAKLLFL